MTYSVANFYLASSLLVDDLCAMALRARSVREYADRGEAPGYCNRR